MKIPDKLKLAPLVELEAWAAKRNAPRKIKECACKRCGRQQLHWERIRHPTLKGHPMRLLLITRAGKIHECKSKFRVRIVRLDGSTKTYPPRKIGVPKQRYTSDEPIPTEGDSDYELENEAREKAWGD